MAFANLRSIVVIIIVLVVGIAATATATIILVSRPVDDGRGGGGGRVVVFRCCRITICAAQAGRGLIESQSREETHGDE
jgi:hypothetical protein